MSRVLLIHWHREEAEERAERLRAAGHRVDTYWHTDGTGARAVRDNPPDVFVIDLTRLPSHGRNSAVWLRQQKPTRSVPIVFVGGEPEKVDRARELIPDATFVEWRRIRGAVRSALRAGGSRDAVVPHTPGFYSGRPLVAKLGVQPSTTLALLSAPKGFDKTLGRLPDGVRVKRQARGKADMVILFVGERAELDKRFTKARAMMAKGGSLWIVWPKKASKTASDLTQPKVREYGMTRGLVDFKVASVDDTWTGLRFARKKR